MRILTPVFIVGLGLGAVLDYLRTSREAENRFAERQRQLALQAAERLSAVFSEVDKLLSLLRHVRDVTRSEPRAGAEALSAVVAQLAEHGALLVCRLDLHGRVTLSSSTPAAGLSRLLQQAGQCGRGQGMCIRGPHRTDTALSPSGRALVASRTEADPSTGQDTLASARPAVPAERSAGTLVVVLDWGVLQELISRITRLSPDTHSWVLDQRGRLILHPEHPDQLGRAALEPTEACARCHESFELHRRMAGGEAGVGRVQVAAGEAKLAAFTPFAVGREMWSLGVATPARLASTPGRRNVLSIFLFTGAIMLVMVAGALLLDREASRRIRAVGRFNQELERQVNERTEEAGALYHRLASMQSQFTNLERTAVAGEMASIVAHEVRTPLNALSINAQMISRLLQRPLPGDRDRAREVLGTLQGEIQRINSLLQDHLLAHVRRRPTVLVPLCVNDVVLQCISFMGPEADRQGVTLLYAPAPDLPHVRADESKLRQVLVNIVLNAVQAMPRGGEVHLLTQLEEKEVRVRIEDTGPGIRGLQSDDLEQIFKPFVTTKEDGTGLGLAICARLVKEMGGRIQVFSEEGKGACFEVVLAADETEDKRCP